MYGKEARIEIEDDLLPISNSEKMYYKIKACFDLIEDFENYHLIVRIRPDLVLTERKRVDWKLVHLLASEGFLFAAYGYTLAYYGFGVDDKIAIGTPKKMKLYSDLWEQRKKYFPLTGHTSLALYLFDHKVEVCFWTKSWAHKRMTQGRLIKIY